MTILVDRSLLVTEDAALVDASQDTKVTVGPAMPVERPETGVIYGAPPLSTQPVSSTTYGASSDTPQWACVSLPR